MATTVQPTGATVIKAVLLDLNGVLFEDGSPYPGAEQALNWLRQKGYRLRFLTNTASRSRESLQRDLERMGLGPAAGELFTAPMAARAYLKRRGLRAHCLVHPSIAPLFRDLQADDDEGLAATSVVLGDARDGLSYGALNVAFRLVRQGCPLLAIGMNRSFREGGEWFLDAGAFVQAISWAARVEPIVMGKPAAPFFLELLQPLGLQPADCLMVGDDVEADVAGSMAVGMAGCLVQTGKFETRDLERLPSGAAVIQSIAELPALLLST